MESTLYVRYYKITTTESFTEPSVKKKLQKFLYLKLTSAVADGCDFQFT